MTGHLTDAPAGATAPVREPAPQRADLALEELSRLDLDAVPLEAVVGRVAELARASIPGADAVSVTWLRDGRASTVAATSEVVADLDRRQCERGTGPCVDAARSGRTIVLPHLDRERRYPDFAAVAWGTGLQASASVGTLPRGRSRGALNVYDFTGGRLDEASVRLAQVFAGYAAVALTRADLAPGARSASDDARDTLRRAEGVLVARLGCSAEDAGDFLAEQARATARDLVEVAVDVVRAAQRHTPR